MVGEVVELKIDKMTVGGAGIGRHNGLVVFVDYAAPGDLLRVEITEHKKNFAFGRILEIIQKGPNRIEAPCIHFGTCGGCSWQHLNAEEQLRQKQFLVEDSLKEVLKNHPAEIRPIIPSARDFNYRNRVQAIAKNGKFHFRKKQSHDLVQLSKCLIVEEPLNEVIQKPNPGLKEDVRYDLRLNREQKAQVTALDEDVELVGFSQVNRFQNDDLIQHVLTSLQDAPGHDLYEFYAGSGNFTFPFLEKKSFRHLWAVEGSSVLVQNAQAEISKRNISPKKITFHLGDVGKFLKTRWPEEQDVVFLDPPRIGADEFVIKTLALAKPRQILYLSCHPVTLGRDLKRLLAYEPRYKIQFVQAFEMFPQTDHVETLVSLVTH